jgi:hypothetical protein
VLNVAGESENLGVHPRRNLVLNSTEKVDVKLFRVLRDPEILLLVS